MQSNFNFFKSSSVDRPSRYRWNDVPAALRWELKAFCLGELDDYVRVSQPRAILVLGIDTFDRHATYTTDVLSDRSRKRRLMMKGMVFGIPAYGILHPSGARVASSDWSRVSNELLNVFRAA